MTRSLFLALALLTVPRGALAQDDDAEREQARAMFQRGVERFQANDFEGALESFQEAYRLRPHPSVRVNMANCYERLARPLEAIFHFERFLAESGNVTPAQRREVESALTRLRGQVGEIAVRVQPEGAVITVDGGETRRTPLSEPVRVAAGRHTIEATLDGHVTESRTVTVEGGGEATVEITLRPEATEAEPLTGQGSTEPPATGGNETAGGLGGAAQETEEDDGDGGGRFRLTAPVIAAGATTVALGVAALGAGISALRADSDFDRAVTRSNDPSRSAAERAEARQNGLDAKDRADRRALLTDIFLIGAGVGAAVTVVLLFVTRDDGDGEHAGGGDAVEAGAAVGPDGAAVFLRRAF